LKALQENLLSTTHSADTANMAGKKTGEQNTKKVAGNAKKAEAAAAKAAAENAKKAVEEEQDWSKGAKSNAKK
jgi:stress response protein YsnF